MLRVALPEIGELADPASALVRDAGYALDFRGELTFYDRRNEIWFILLAERDIPTYVSEGQLHLGICGALLTEESSASVGTSLELGFGQSSLRMFAPRKAEWMKHDLAGKRVATRFPRVVRSFLAQERIATRDVIRLERSHTAIEMGVADAIAEEVDPSEPVPKALDFLETIGEPIFDSQATLIHRVGRFDMEPDGPEVSDAKNTFVERLRSVSLARTLDLLQYDCPNTVLEASLKYIGSDRTPVVAPLSDPEWSTVRLLVDNSSITHVVQALVRFGCRDVMTSALRSYRAGD